MINLWCKRIVVLLGILCLCPGSVYAQEDAWTYTETDEHPGKDVTIPPQEFAKDIDPPESLENLDPLEDINRGIFFVNEFLDMVLIEPVGKIYKDLLPESLRISIGYALRNLSEPIVFVNNILQGNLEQARVTFWRLILNSTLGVGGLFDVSTSLGFPYKKEDFGLTLASWGVCSGPYIVLPVLGPSSLRDSIGRIGDFSFDPINWWAIFDNQIFYSYTRSGAQIIDAKSDAITLMDELKKDSVDYYATIRAWYLERRKALAKGNQGMELLDTPRPDDDDDESL